MKQKEYIIQISTVFENFNEHKSSKLYGLSNLGRMFEYISDTGHWQLKSQGLD